MRAMRLFTPLLVSVSIAGCGTYVPALQEIPGDVAGGQILVQDIVSNVTCEVQNAINDIIRRDIEDVRSKLFKQRRTAWLDSWGVQMSLNLTVSEKGTVNPTVNWLPPSPPTAIFNLAGAANLSTEATRIDKVGAYYTVQELVARGPCDQSLRPGGLFLLQSDLKLKEWLLHNVQFEGTGMANFPSKKDGPLKQDVISHQVKFEVLTGANITPGWRLTRVVVNQSGSLLSASRTRTHTLLITLGPAEVPVAFVVPGTGRAGVARILSGQRILPGAAASNAHLASEIGIAVRDNLQQ